MRDRKNDGRDPFGAIAAVAHELRTPLTAIQGAVEILGDEVAGPLSPAQREFVNLAHRNLIRLKDRIEDALEIAATQDSGDAEPVLVNLEEISECVAVRAKTESGADQRVTFVGFQGDWSLSIPGRSLCRTLASGIGSVERHARTRQVVVEATVCGDRLQFAISAGSRQDEVRADSVIHDASLALAREVIDIYGGSLSALELGRCGIYVLLPLWPIGNLRRGDGRDQESSAGR